MTVNKNRLQDLQNNSIALDVRGYTRFIRFLKIALPIGAIAIIGLLLLWPQLSAIQTEPLNERDLKALKQAEKQNTLLRPVFNTVDVNGKPIAIKADSAVQNRNNIDQIILTSPAATMNDNGSILEFHANDGVYNQSDKILDLANGVVLKDSNNNVLTTDSLTADINQGKAISQSPATLTTKEGVIEGQSVIIDQQNQTTIFQGPAKAVINP
jgi:lipopolysaccharide export system protein LptC